MNLPEGENVRSHDTIQWALRQAEYLTPVQAHVLLYLTASAFYRQDNQEDAQVSQVMRERRKVPAICRYTGLSRKTVQRVLGQLEEADYIISGDRFVNNQPVDIFVLWSDFWEQSRVFNREEAKAAMEAPTAPPKRMETPPDDGSNVVYMADWVSS